LDDDSSTWDDWDDNMGGPMEEAHDEYPEGFIWSCCERQGGSENFCQLGQHLPKANRKRARLAGS